MSTIRVKVFFYVFALAVLASCSMPKILYNNADFLLLYWFDDYFELNERQHSDLKKDIKNLLSWHRKSELPKIALFLEELRFRYKKGIKEEDINWTRDQFKEFLERIFSHIEGDLVSFLLTIEENQISKMKTKLVERDDLLVKQLKMGSSELHGAILDWLYGVLEDWLGNLESSQKQKIASWVKPDVFWITIKLRNRKKFQNDLARLFQSKESLKENLNIWVYHPESHWTDEFKTHVGDKKKEWVDIILKIDAITLPRQRKHGMDELQGYIDDFRSLTKIEVH